MLANVKRIVSAALCLLICLSAAAFPTTAAEPSDSNLKFANTYLEKTKGVHPSIMYTEEDIPALQAKTEKMVSKTAFIAMKTLADSYVRVSVTPYKYSGGGVSGRGLSLHVATLAFYGELLGGDEGQKYIDHAVDILVSAAEQGSVRKYLDENDALCVGDFASAYAIGYDWLYDDMSEDERKTVYDHMMELGEWIYVSSTTGTQPISKGTDSHAHWADANQYRSAWNWNTVAHTGLTLISMATGEHPEWMARGLDRIEEYYKYSKNADGMPQEGLSYTGYGMRYCVIIDAALVQHTDISLIDKYPELQKFLDYYTWAQLPCGKGEATNVNQSNSLCNVSIPMYLSARYQDPGALWALMYGTGILNGTVGSLTSVWHGNGFDLPQLILFEDQSLINQIPAEGGVKNFGGQEVIYRTGFASGSGARSITMASVRANTKYGQIWHHPDCGSVTFYALGQNFILDQGSGKRAAEDHNAPLLGIHGIKDASKATLLSSEEIADGVFLASVNTAGAYSTARPKSAVRHVLVVDGEQPYMFVLDQIELRSADTVKTNWFTGGTVAAADIGLQISGAAYCGVQVFNPAEGGTFTIGEGNASFTVTSPQAKDVLQGTLFSVHKSSKSAPEISREYAEDGSMTITVVRTDKDKTVHTDVITAAKTGITYTTTAVTPEPETTAPETTAAPETTLPPETTAADTAATAEPTEPATSGAPVVILIAVAVVVVAVAAVLLILRRKKTEK